MASYWVYLPDIDEAGCVVEADSFEGAYHAGYKQLYPDDGVEVQVCWLGDSTSFVAGEEIEEIEEPTGEEYLKTKAFLVELAGRADANVGEEITRFLNENGSVVCLSIAARYLRDDPKAGPMFEKIKEALLGGC